MVRALDTATTAPGAVLGIVTGLAAERSCLSRGDDRVRVVCAGASSARARTLADELADSGCAALVSFGVAGGLDPALAAGAVLLPQTVIAPDGRRFATDAGWRQRLLAAIGESRPIRTGELAGLDAPLAVSADKAALFASTGAAAVDMESHAVAEVAARRSLPLLVVRAVADPAGQRIPRWLDGVIAANGRPRLAVLLAGVAAHPADVPTLLRLAAASRRAMASLGCVAALSGPRFAFAS